MNSCNTYDLKPKATVIPMIINVTNHPVPGQRNGPCWSNILHTSHIISYQKHKQDETERERERGGGRRGRGGGGGGGGEGGHLS